MSHLPVGDSQVGEVNDLATLAKLDETILLNEVKVRYENDRIYVSTAVQHNVRGLYTSVYFCMVVGYVVGRC